MSELPATPTPAAAFEQNRTILDINSIGMKGARYLTFEPLKNLSAGVVEVSMEENTRSHRSLTCRVEYSIKSAGSHELYALGVYIGVRPNDNSDFAVCTLVRCKTLATCGDPVDGYAAGTVFESLTLSGTFPSTSTVYATAFQTGLKLLDPSVMSVGANNLVISDNTQPLLSASLWARVI